MNWAILPFKRFADLAGRSRRLEFWTFTLLATVLILIAHYADATRGNAVWGGMGLIELVATALLIVPSITVSVRRLHDSGKSGWWTLLLYGPYAATLLIGDVGQGLRLVVAAVLLIGALGWFALMVQPGTAGVNRFGIDPKTAGQIEPDSAA